MAKSKVNEIRAERLAHTANPLALVAQQQIVYHPQNYPNHYTHNSSTRSQQTATRNRGKEIVNSPLPTYDQEPEMVAEDDALSKDKEIDKPMALISLSFKKIYKPTNNNLRTSSNTNRENQDNTPRINRGTGECQKPKRAKDAAYHKEKMLLCKQEKAGFQLNAEQAGWRDDTNDEPDDQVLEAHYMYMAQIQEVTLDATDNFGPIFDTEPLQKVQNDDNNYNVFANDKEHPVQPEFVKDAYLEEQCDPDITIEPLDISTNGETVDHDDDDLAKERDLLASLIEKLKYLKKFQAELDRYHDVNYASNVEIDCAKPKGCYNDNLALMLASESDEIISLAQESRSKLSDLIKPFDYKNLNNLYDLFVPQREKSPKQRYFSERINADLEKFHLCLKEEMDADLRYFNSLEHEVDSLKSLLETQKTQFLNQIDQLSREYYYADHMNVILGMYITLDEFTDLQCDYVDQVIKCERLEKELSKSNITSKSFEELQQHAIDLELALHM
ncbi:hypothetical protein Tco_1130578 [Tanacetum coccineum]